MVHGGLPFPDTGFPLPDVYIYYVPDAVNVWILFLHLPIFLGCFFSTKDWIIQNGPPSYQIKILSLG